MVGSRESKGIIELRWERGKERRSETSQKECLQRKKPSKRNFAKIDLRDRSERLIKKVEFGIDYLSTERTHMGEELTGGHPRGMEGSATSVGTADVCASL